MSTSGNNKVPVNDADESVERHDYDASNPKNIKEAARRSKQRDLDRENGLRFIMSQREGRLWIWDFLADSGVFQTSFHTSNSVMAFNEGKRQRGLELLATLTRECPQDYLLMQSENIQQGE